MDLFLRKLRLIMVILLTVYVGGCGEDNEEVQEIPNTAFVSANPAQGNIEPNSTITVTFDNIARGRRSKCRCG